MDLPIPDEEEEGGPIQVYKCMNEMGKIDDEELAFKEMTARNAHGPSGEIFA